MFSQIYGMNYYNAVLLYSSFHHGISKCFISINYSTPRGGKWKIDTHIGVHSRRVITQISSGSSPRGSALTIPPSCKGYVVTGSSWVAQPSKASTSSLGSVGDWKMRAGYLGGGTFIPQVGCSYCCLRHCFGSGCS